MWDGSCNWGAECNIIYRLSCSLGDSNRVWYQEAMLSLIKGMSGIFALTSLPLRGYFFFINDTV